MVQDYAISEEKSAAMNELMQLARLETVKRQAMAVFTAAFSDKKLRESLPNNGAKVKCSSVLNFAFMGNPGTGKTTVARIFASILEAAGARLGHKFEEMKASQEIRKGGSKFALDLASLTGGDLNVGPPRKTYSEGRRSR